MMTVESLGNAPRRSPGQSVPDRIRERLMDGMGLWKAQLAYGTAILEVLDANHGDRPTSVDRATTALHMYRAVEAIEEFGRALDRLENGRYGTCESCGGPITIARLEVLPQTPFCAACPPTSR
jgi:RNA polymerase-binding transcription factor DksA